MLGKCEEEKEREEEGRNNRIEERRGEERRGEESRGMVYILLAAVMAMQVILQSVRKSDPMSLTRPMAESEMSEERRRGCE